jgi:hypothetical protein
MLGNQLLERVSIRVVFGTNVEEEHIDGMASQRLILTAIQTLATSASVAVGVSQDIFN